MESRQDRLGSILSSLVERHGWRRAEWISLLKLLWKEVAGDVLYEHSGIITLTSDNTLIVAVPTSVWAQQLSLLKPLILKNISETHPEIKVRDIRTRVRTDRPSSIAQPERSKFSPYYHDTSRQLTETDLHVLLASVKEKYELASRDWLTRGFSPCRRCWAPTLDGYPLCVVCELESTRDES